ncbi:MAG: endonuclease domain-containing protein [Chloroflexota bacterium]|nr:endonuclease domain-containing protein [Chloroflexota bacterium]
MPQAERAGRLTSFIRAGQLHNMKSSRTRIENLMADLLLVLGVAYERNVQIGRHNVDFLLGRRTVVECYGDYGHCNPLLYVPSYYHKPLHMTAMDKWKRDRSRQAELEAQGYAFVSFWEKDIRENLTGVQEALIRFLPSAGEE